MTAPAPITRPDALALLGALASEQRIDFFIGWANASADNTTAIHWLRGQQDNARNSFAQSLIGSMQRFGSLTPGQVAACVRNVENDARRAVERAERVASAAPFSPVNGEHTVIGKVLSCRLKANRYDTYGVTFKATVEVTQGPWTGNRLYMTLPRAVREAVGSDEPRDFIGVSMEVTGTIERTTDDPHFGFLARPRARFLGKEDGAR